MVLVLCLKLNLYIYNISPAILFDRAKPLGALHEGRLEVLKIEKRVHAFTEQVAITLFELYPIEYLFGRVHFREIEIAYELHA